MGYSMLLLPVQYFSVNDISWKTGSNTIIINIMQYNGPLEILKLCLAGACLIIW